MNTIESIHTNQDAHGTMQKFDLMGPQAVCLAIIDSPYAICLFCLICEAPRPAHGVTKMSFDLFNWVLFSMINTAVESFPDENKVV